MISDRDYSSWKFVGSDSSPIECVLPTTFNTPHGFNPLQTRLFTRDVIDSTTGELVHSSVRSGIKIAGVLMLEGNKSYGRTENKKRLLYRCIPDDRYLPVFLVPYEIKLGFEKNVQNKYVVFQFDSWNDKHPRGILTEVLGDVGDLGAFYEYQLHCRSLNISMSGFNASVSKTALIDSRDEDTKCISSGKEPFIFSIDPAGSLDYDDAFSISETEISIYIANVYVWLDKLNLWKSFSKRVSTIYLPDRRRPMLPTILSDNLCSLVNGKTRHAFVLTVRFDSETKQFGQPTFSMREIVVSKNFVYDSKDLLANPHYMRLYEISKIRDADIQDSYDMVASWMIYMNSICGQTLFRERKGIYRSVQLMHKNRHTSQLNASDAAKQCIKNWRNTSGQYCVFNEDSMQTHELLGVEHYAQITSPIRRLVDLLNQMMMIELCGVSLSTEAAEFLSGWLKQIDYVNTAMRSIRKVQTDCEILYKCSQNPQWKNTDLEGIVFDGVQRSDGTYAYMVFLEEPRILARVYSVEKWEEHEKRFFRVFLFDDETKLCTKVRVVGV